MHTLETIKLSFDPKKSENPEVQEIFKSRIGTILWCLIKAGHVTDQYFNKNILEASEKLEESRTTQYRVFLEITSRLNKVFGRTCVYETMIYHEDAIDNEFWGDIFKAIHQQRCFNLEINDGTEKNQ